LQMNLTARGTRGEGSVQFRMNIRRSLNFVDFEEFNTREFHQMSRCLGQPGGVDAISLYANR
jgi:hypothetical protein